MPVVYDSKSPDGRNIGGVNPVTTQSTDVLAVDKEPRTKTCKDCGRTLPIGNFQNYGRNARICADCRGKHQQPHGEYKKATANRRKVPKKAEPEPAPKEEHPEPDQAHPLVELVKQALDSGLTVEVTIK